MKCKVCGNESGKYPLCRGCNAQKEAGLIIKCAYCGNWHYAGQPCKVTVSDPNQYLYEPKRALITKMECSFFAAIRMALPAEFYIFPQINLASFIERTDDARYHNELFRNVDFLVTDNNFHPLLVVEINDQTHLTPERKERDEKVKKICEEAGIPIVNFWTSYGVNQDYIRAKLTETIAALPVQRIHHFQKAMPAEPIPTTDMNTAQNIQDLYSANNQGYFPPNGQRQYSSRRRGGCYIATCVYGSYDCPQVWTLRRFRDLALAKSVLGRLFISTYYAISPTLVKVFGSQKWFQRSWKAMLDRMIRRLNASGYEDTPYSDK